MTFSFRLLPFELQAKIVRHAVTLDRPVRVDDEMMPSRGKGALALCWTCRALFELHHWYYEENEFSIKNAMSFASFMRGIGPMNVHVRHVVFDAYCMRDSFEWPRDVFLPLVDPASWEATKTKAPKKGPLSVWELCQQLKSVDTIRVLLVRTQGTVSKQDVAAVQSYLVQIVSESSCSRKQCFVDTREDFNTNERPGFVAMRQGVEWYPIIAGAIIDPLLPVLNQHLQNMARQDFSHESDPMAVCIFIEEQLYEWHEKAYVYNFRD